MSPPAGPVQQARAAVAPARRSRGDGPYLRTPPRGKTFSLIVASTLSHSASLALGMTTWTGGRSNFPFVKTLRGGKTRDR